MAITDILKSNGTDSEQQCNFSCPHYTPAPNSKHCQHYFSNGACSRDDILMCHEWLKANGHTEPEPKEAPQKEKVLKVPKDLFGHPLPPPPKEKQKKHKADPPKYPTRLHLINSKEQEEEKPPPSGLTIDDIKSFKNLQLEVCILSEPVGELWLVPTYTEKDRQEIIPEHLATITQVLQAFSGQVVEFKKPQAEPVKEGIVEK